MRAPSERPVALGLVALALSVPCVATANDDRERAARRWFVPDHGKLQLGGDVGFVSPGIGYEVAGRRVHLDVLFGWVPAWVGGHDIYSLTGKLTYAPSSIDAGARWRVEPVRAALQLTRTFGSQYFTRLPDRYPSGYYEVPTAWHAGVALGGAVAREVAGGDGREVGVYWELVALALRLRDWSENRGALGLTDVVTVAVGATVGF
jgi:hypothetical protein